MKEITVTFDTLPDEMGTHIADYLDIKSLCFFAATSKRSLGNALNQLRRYHEGLHHQFRIHAGVAHALYQTPHALYACGRNEFGQLSLGHNKGCNNWTPIKTPSKTVRQIAEGGIYTLALTDQGLYACGSNNFGQLGLGHNNDCNNWMPVEIPPGIVRRMVVGGDHTFVLTDQGLYACGWNMDGQLGLGHNNTCNNWTPVEIPPGTIQQVVAGGEYTMVLTDQGLYACGSNNFGQLGLGHYDHCNTFTLVKALPAEIKHWFYVTRHIDRLIALSGYVDNHPAHSDDTAPAVKWMKTL